MLLDAVEFAVADLIVSAVNTAALDSANFGAFQVTAELDPAAATDLSKAGTGVRVFVIPADSSSVPNTLDGIIEDSIEIHIAIAKKLSEGTAEEVRQLVSLCRSVWSIIETNVHANNLIWVNREVDELYDFDAVRIKREFYAEAFFTWRRLRG